MSPQQPEAKLPRKPIICRVPAVTRALRILEHLAATSEPVGVVTLARSVNLIPSTCLHILRVLVDEGLVAFDARTKRYFIGPGVLAFSQSYVKNSPLVRASKRWLHRMSLEHQCAFAALQLSGRDHSVVVGIGDAHSGLSVRLSVGTRLPALVSATGVCFAAFEDFSAEELAKGFVKLSWDTPPRYEDWLGQVAEARQLGYAVDDGRYIKGAKAIAVPLFQEDGTLLGSVAAFGLQEQMEGRKQQSLIAALRGLQSEVGRDACYDPAAGDWQSDELAA